MTTSCLLTTFVDEQRGGFAGVLEDDDDAFPRLLGVGRDAEAAVQVQRHDLAAQLEHFPAAVDRGDGFRVGRSAICTEVAIRN